MKLRFFMNYFFQTYANSEVLKIKTSMESSQEALLFFVIQLFFEKYLKSAKSKTILIILKYFC